MPNLAEKNQNRIWQILPQWFMELREGQKAMYAELVRLRKQSAQASDSEEAFVLEPAAMTREQHKDLLAAQTRVQELEQVIRSKDAEVRSVRMEGDRLWDRLRQAETRENVLKNQMARRPVEDGSAQNALDDTYRELERLQSEATALSQEMQELRALKSEPVSAEQGAAQTAETAVLIQELSTAREELREMEMLAEGHLVAAEEAQEHFHRVERLLEAATEKLEEERQAHDAASESRCEELEAANAALREELEAAQTRVTLLESESATFAVLLQEQTVKTATAEERQAIAEESREALARQAEELKARAEKTSIDLAESQERVDEVSETLESTERERDSLAARTEILNTCLKNERQETRDILQKALSNVEVSLEEFSGVMDTPDDGTHVEMYRGTIISDELIVEDTMDEQFGTSLGDSGPLQAMAG